MTQPGLSSSSHLDRKALKRPDTFAKSLRSGLEFLFGNPRAVAIGGLISLAVLIGSAWWISKTHKAEAAAATALFEAERSFQREFESLTKDLKPVAPAKNGKAKAVDSPKPDALLEFQYKSLDVDATFKASVPLYRSTFESHPKTAAAHRARMTLAKLYFDHGEPEKAVGLYMDAAKLAPKILDKASALFALGLTQETLNQTPEALATFQSLALLQDSQIKDQALLGLARNYELAGDVEKAKVTYGQIQKDHPESEAAQVAIRRLGQWK